MIESGLYTWTLANPALTALLAKATANFPAPFYFSFLPKEAPLPAIVLDHLRLAEAGDTLDARTPVPGTMVESRFQFGCMANDATTNPANFSGYLSAALLAKTLRLQLMGLATGKYVLPDGTTLNDLKVEDEFDAHFDLGGEGYLYRRMLVMTILYVEGAN